VSLIDKIIDIAEWLKFMPMELLKAA